MPGDYEKAISIKDAIDAINNRDFLLPAIQRKFIWSSNQICVLFDSIMRGYPINTFMMWEITDESIKNSYKFYEFLKYYCQRFNEENTHIETNANFKNFKAIIDGQQRLTSLYIGLCSTYAYKQPRIWWPSTKDDSALPPRKLYLDLKQSFKSEDDESLMKYNFKFLTDEFYLSTLKNQSPEHHWFCLQDILRMPKVDGSSQVWMKIVHPYLEKHNLTNNDFSGETLLLLHEKIHSQKIIHYFNETSQEIDYVLDVFIRTNSGGTKLEYSNLLMSIAVAHWDGDFKKELDDLISFIHLNLEMGFYIERDWVLKTCLMLINADVKFQVKNFQTNQIQKIQREWEQIKKCIKSTFKLIRRFGINPQSLTSKNAVIPICYYLYKKKIDNQHLFEQVNNLAKCHDNREAISRWFYMTLLKGVFGGQADTILSSMRDVLDEHMENDLFPLNEIVNKYIATNKDLRFDNSYIESLLDTQYGEGRCRALLHLLFPEMIATEIFHIDHLHPKNSFQKSNLKNLSFLKQNDNLLNFYNDPKHWNSISNLQLLNHSQNGSKNDRSLKNWIDSENTQTVLTNLLIDDINLEFSEFKIFYEKRRSKLRDKLIGRVFMSDSPILSTSADDSDEEVVEENI